MPISFRRYVKYNPFNDMLITGIRRENPFSSFDIMDEPDENHETRIISCSSYFDHLFRSLSSIIDNIDRHNFVNLCSYWEHILEHTAQYYNVLKGCEKNKLQPTKFVSGFISYCADSSNDFFFKFISFPRVDWRF